MEIFVVAAFTLLLGVYFWSDSFGFFWGRAVSKTTLSALFLAVGCLEVNLSEFYDRALITGLIAGFAGDVFLLFNSKPMFLSGLVVFLIGHILYIMAFAHVISTSIFPPLNFSLVLQIAVLLIFSISVYGFYLRPHVKAMKIPVLCYIFVITAMLASAIILSSLPNLTSQSKQLALFGALLFFISDLGVARQQFVTKSIYNSLICLPAYYIAQFLLAYSLRHFA